jgi:hypothetical protein
MPTAREQWDDVVHAVVANRTWMATTDRHAELPAIMRSDVERYDRLIELDDILATAPADSRHLVSQLRDGQLSFDDTAELLQAALVQQDARRGWIIEHWPHIVEYQELLAAESAGVSRSDVVEPELEIEL